MDVAKLALEYLKALSWPIVTLIGILVFRRELQLLFRSLQRLRLPGGTELDWEKKLAKAEAVAAEIERAPAQQEVSKAGFDVAALVAKSDRLGFLRSASDFKLDYYFKLATEDPNVALAALRMELERMLQNLATANKVEFDPYHTSPGGFSRLLRAKGVIPPDQYELLRRVVDVANDALHGRDVTREQAFRTIDSAGPLFRFYLSWLDRWPGGLQ